MCVEGSVRSSVCAGADLQLDNDQKAHLSQPQQKKQRFLCALVKVRA